MTEKKPLRPYKLLHLIVNDTKRKQVEDIMEEYAVPISMALRAKGTVKRSWLKHLGVRNQGKLQYHFALPEDKADAMLDVLKERLHLGNPGQGIAYLKPLLFGITPIEAFDAQELQDICLELCREEGNMYKKISVIVDLGLADEVIEAARQGGARGGTILHGHGSATEEHAKLFGFEIVPEKELVIILTPNQYLEPVIKSINDKIKLDQSGNGILYVEDVESTVGLYEG